MTEPVPERRHRALYALYIAAIKLERRNVTTNELYEHAGEFRGVQLLKSEQDTAALLKELRDRDWAEKTGQDGRAFTNRITDEGMELLEELGAPDDVPVKGGM